MKWMNKYFLLFVVCWQFNALYSTEVNVRILTTKVIKSFIFSSLNGNYILYSEGKTIADCDASGIFQMTIENDSILLKTFEATIGKFTSITIKSKNANAGFKIKSVVPDSKIRAYDGDLEIKFTTDKQQFLLINTVDLEKYIAGVVESESGLGNEIEYYKIQAILIRTYLLAHLDRHVLEGFQVCDDVHCQAYLNKSKNSDILKAILQTKGMVIVDADLNLITAAFHSNCGGETVSSEDVWFMPTSYLKSVVDTFCRIQPHARWERKILMEDWKAYLQLKHNYLVNDSLKMGIATSFSQRNGREVFFIDKDLKIPLKTIRTDFKLKSTYFSVEEKGDEVILKGKGYGHGVGLCQEGAMRMADLNYTCTQILHFYYKNVDLIDLNALNYFKKE